MVPAAASRGGRGRTPVLAGTRPVFSTHLSAIPRYQPSVRPASAPRLLAGRSLKAFGSDCGTHEGTRVGEDRPLLDLAAGPVGPADDLPAGGRDMALRAWEPCAGTRGGACRHLDIFAAVTQRRCPVEGAERPPANFPAMIGNNEKANAENRFRRSSQRESAGSSSRRLSVNFPQVELQHPDSRGKHR